uniref:RNase H type-1 domain-containing protein n=1 Tax=Cacopsylla melanoneura TaxID=428564 RepID=A0A8D8XQG2_9HEMI
MSSIINGFSYVSLSYCPSSMLYHSSCPPSSNFLICSDSLSAIHCLLNDQNINPIALSIRKLLFDYKRRYNIEFIWVPSHVGIPGNEKADQLAKEALNENIPCMNSVTTDDKKNSLKKLILSSWNDLWIL